MTSDNLQDVLAAARRLPGKAQAELVETLLRDGNVLMATEQPELEIVRGMSETELRALANAVLAPRHERRLKSLLRKHKHGKLREPEQQDLDSLLEESDRVALLKAKAAYTLMRLCQANPAAA